MEQAKKETISTLDTGSSRTLADRVCHQLKDDIITGRLSQGSKIVEEDLAREHGVSRGPLREAIRRLEAMHLVQRIPHAGARVVTLSEKMMSDVYSVREALEGMSTRLAAEFIKPKEVDELWLLLEQHEKNIDATEGTVYFQREGDVDFHIRIAQASQNQLLVKSLSSELYQLIRMCRYRTAKAPSRPTKALGEHRQIVDAISRRDGELAEILMRRHISGAWQIARELLLKDYHD
ncbi:GntR family transcriptional regulator [Solemya velum gill symbiont]|uniref:GntR family transcriptional regulator n=1 Tax=Solemya velum gill symbiont TaxID=2340 RepID=UPI000996F2C2|nr:GntR family transcriptional regulator [Solemya velum gill symbiont]OOZ15222.1 GntR family transcriptional regulator [Solemya velum gill symbiont]OOZ17010.1 GntR family transcriptional regulator [Solemya velum gill symbiont]OOZ19902.1 GntR family transcriptional regulator [Solemya velum gill symbiont]OOZ22437.1 GntR family transcriptional regulator [Solemya velum gill symbiont]OOZ24770.1 GntR family transcriptional regulator [Solemya velum gill symbiont]